MTYRRSAVDRDGTGLGLQRQLHDCQKLADRHGWRLVGDYVDDGTARHRGRVVRPGFEQMLDDLAAGRFDGIATWALDRIARRPEDLERLIGACEQHGVEVHAVQAGDLNLNAPSGRMAGRLLAAAAQHERSMHSERIKRGIQARRERLVAQAGQ